MNNTPNPKKQGRVVVFAENTQRAHHCRCARCFYRVAMASKDASPCLNADGKKCGDCPLALAPRDNNG